MSLRSWFVDFFSEAPPLTCPRPGCGCQVFRELHGVYSYRDCEQIYAGRALGCMRCGLAFTLPRDGRPVPFEGPPRPQPAPPVQPNGAPPGLRVRGGDDDMRWGEPR